MHNTRRRFEVGLIVVGALGLTGPALADDTGVADSAPPMAKVTSTFLQGPSLRETGRIAPTFVQGAAIQRRDDLATLEEASVLTMAAADRRAQADTSGVIDDEVLNREIAARLAAAQACRLEVARHRQVSPSDVAAGPLSLRWTILPSGSVGSTVVSATALEDTDLVDCVKRQMVSWTFTRPRGGQVDVARAFQLTQR